MARLRRPACPSPIRFYGVYILSTLPQIDCTEQFVRFHLDAARNHLLRFDILLSGIATTMSAGAVITGIFGMNLPTHLFDEDDGAPLPTPTFCHRPPRYPRGPRIAGTFNAVAIAVGVVSATLTIALATLLYAPRRWWKIPGSMLPSTAPSRPPDELSLAHVNVRQNGMSSS